MSKSVILAAVLAIVAVGGAWLYLGRGAPDAMTPVASSAAAQETSATTEAASTATASTSSDMALVPDMILGSADAPLTVMEYASFTCPHCANFHATVWDKFKKKYIDTGKVKFIYREVYFDKYGLWGAMVARCGGPEKYFGISDILYDTQKDWLASGEAVGIADALRRVGITAGMTADQVDACLKDNAKAQAMVTAYQTNATNDKIEGTPTFIIAGESHSGEMTYDEFAALLDAKLPK